MWMQNKIQNYVTPLHFQKAKASGVMLTKKKMKPTLQQA
jgi:hypothetical protein